MKPLLEEVEELLLEWDAGTLDSAGVERLRELLRSNEDARDIFLEHQTLTAALQLESSAGLDLAKVESGQESSGSPGSSPMGPSQSGDPSRTPQVRIWLATAASLLICLLGGRLLYLELTERDVAAPTTAQRDEPEATASGIALVTRLVDVKWEQNQRSMEVGDALEPGRLTLAAGFAQIEFFCGATLIVEGPAELELISPTQARVYSGRMRAQVPPAARGFSLDVDDMRIVDLGTEFGLAVSESGADVQVFDGEVEVTPADMKKQLLTAGQAVVRTAAGNLETATVTPERFLDIAALDAREHGQQAARYERWRSWSEELRTDPRLIAYYTFDQTGGWERKLQDSTLPNDSQLDGAIVGARRTEGRWPSKSALEFKRPGDRVRVQIPGQFASLTFSCWVRIDSLDRWYNSLFLTDHYNEGEPHWQILDTGQLFFSVRHKPDNLQGEGAKGPTHHVVLSPPFWEPSLSGRWVHVATTYDAVAGQITHYLNGVQLHEETITEELRVGTTRIGSASIGNWSIPTKPDAAFAVRNLNGSVDEFAIFSSALSAEEVKEIYRNGKP